MKKDLNQIGTSKENDPVLLDEEMEKIPYYMRERVAFLINQKVEQRVAEHMKAFKEEIANELED